MAKIVKEIDSFSEFIDNGESTKALPMLLELKKNC